MKQEFLSYLRDHDEPEETDINTVCNLIEAVQLINCYKKIIEAQYKRVQLRTGRNPEAAQSD